MTSALVAPGQPLTPQQKTGLELVAHLPWQGGRDVVLAIDVTESVGLNDEGRIRLRQIVEDSLNPGDSVYVVPFASDVVLPEQASDVYLGKQIEFRRKDKDNIEKILKNIPLAPDLKQQNTDIQRAELTIYQGLAQINQNRLQEHQPIKQQSVIWVTDAPLFTLSGSEWIETPANSPFRVKDSPESQQRRAWFAALPMTKRELTINNYKLTVVDIAPTVQEFCTPAPSGQVLCKVNPYLFGQLWPPAAILATGVAAIGFLLWQWIKLQKKWRLIVTFEENGDEKECRPLSFNQQIAIGEADSRCIDAIDSPGSEVRAYLARQGNQLYLVPNKSASVPVEWSGKEITKRTRLTGTIIKLNCPDEKHRDFYIDIKIKK